MVTYTLATTPADLQGILVLQQANLAQHLSADEIQEQGFVTLQHSPELLRKLNDRERHIIAKDQDQVVGYLLAMTKASRWEIPLIYPMFQVFDTLSYAGRPISDYSYLLVGQACVDKNYRGQGVFDACYHAYREHYQEKYAFAITEIAAHNLRSRQAHRRVGFKEIHTYGEPGKPAWVVVLWDWRGGQSD